MDDEDCLARFDFIAVSEEHLLFDLCSIQICAVGASFINYAATVLATFHSEVYAGHLTIVRNGKFRAPRRPPNKEGLPKADRDFLSCKRPGFNFKNYTQILAPTVTRVMEFHQLKEAPCQAAEMGDAKNSASTIGARTQGMPVMAFFGFRARFSRTPRQPEQAAWN